MFSQILVPLDGSELSERALADACSLSERYSASLTLLTVMLRFPESRLHVPLVDDHSQERGRKYLEEAAGRLPAGVHAETVVQLGVPAFEIASYARRQGVDLIVMSTHGTTGTDRIRSPMGSTAWTVLHDTPCPVLLVPVHRADAIAQ
jgi:nucleotide-binding universal stress UspA family protein